MDEIRILFAVIDNLEEQDELALQQHSRIKWLKEGDYNSRFFHQTTIQRRCFNRIEKLQDGQGVCREDTMGINQVVQDHFTDLFTSGGQREWGQVLYCIHLSISKKMNSHLTRPITIHEIKEAAFQMEGLKAPGPDGLQGIFY